MMRRISGKKSTSRTSVSRSTAHGTWAHPTLLRRSWPGQNVIIVQIDPANALISVEAGGNRRQQLVSAWLACMAWLRGMRGAWGSTGSYTYHRH